MGSDDPRDIFSDGDTEFERESFGISATIEADFTDTVMLRSITSYFDIEQTGDQTNNDGVDITFLTDNYKQENKEWSQEFTLTGSSENFEWIGGVYYYESDIEEVFLFTLPALQATFEALFGIFGGGPPLPSGSLAFFGTRFDGSSVPFPFLDFGVDQELTSFAGVWSGYLQLQRQFARHRWIALDGG